MYMYRALCKDREERVRSFGRMVFIEQVDLPFIQCLVLVPSSITPKRNKHPSLPRFHLPLHMYGSNIVLYSAQANSRHKSKRSRINSECQKQTQQIETSS
jgi:hypothetical protein